MKDWVLEVSYPFIYEIGNARLVIPSDKNVSESLTEKKTETTKKYDEWIKELEKIEVNEEVIKQKVNDLLEALENYNSQETN